MHIILAPFGTHGDVHPFVGLGLALKNRGHRISLVTAAPFRELAERHGFDFAAAVSEDDFRATISDPDIWHPTKSLNVLFEPARLGRALRQSHAHFAARYEPGDTVIVAGTLNLAARIAHEKLGVPLATVHLQPLSVFSLIDPPVTASGTVPRWWPMWLRRLVRWYLERFAVQKIVGGPVNQFRRELGLARQNRIWGTWRHSPQRVIGLFPEWYANAPDWPSQLRQTGFLRYDQGEAAELPGDVQAFLEAGPPPVVFTFGSAMRVGNAYFAAAVDACRRGGVRGLLVCRGRDQLPAELPSGVAHADYIPFSQVFSRAAAVVHHGGIGTTAQAITAGVPQIIMPMAFDQPDNAARLERLGVARVVRPGQFTGPTVAAVLAEVLGSDAIKNASKQLANRLMDADPLEETCRLVEELRGTDKRRSEE